MRLGILELLGRRKLEFSKYTIVQMFPLMEN